MAKSITGFLLLSSQTNTDGATTWSSVLDCTTYDGGEIRWRITNGATGPTTQCEARVMVAKKQTSAPAAAAEGTGADDWKIRWVQGGGIGNSTSVRGAFKFGPEIAYIFIEFSGNTGQNVTVEATADVYAY